MPNSLFLIAHVFSVMLLVGVTFAAFAAPVQENRKRFMMFSGIASLLALLTGCGILGSAHMGFPAWAIVKIVCWLIISGISGQAFRNRDKIPQLVGITSAMILLALVMVFAKPF